MRVTVWDVSPSPEGAIKEAADTVRALRQLGYRAGLRLLPPSTYFAYTGDSRNRAQVIDGGWSADYASADDFISKLTCAYFVPGNGVATAKPLTLSLVGGGTIAGSMSIDARTDNPEVKTDLKGTDIELGAFFRNSTQKIMDGNLADTPPIMFVPREQDRACVRAGHDRPHKLAVGRVAGDQAAEDRRLLGEFGCHQRAGRKGLIGH